MKSGAKYLIQRPTKSSKSCNLEMVVFKIVQAVWPFEKTYLWCGYLQMSNFFKMQK